MFQVSAGRCSTWGTKGATQGNCWLVPLTCILDAHFLLGTRCTSQNSILLRQAREFICRVLLFHHTLHGHIGTLNTVLFGDLVRADESALLGILDSICLGQLVSLHGKGCLFSTAYVRESWSELILVLASTLKLVLQLLVPTTLVVRTIVGTTGIPRGLLRIELSGHVTTILTHLNISHLTR